MPSRKERLKRRQKRMLQLAGMAALYEVNISITSTLKLPQLLTLIAKNASLMMNARACSLRLLHANKKELVLKAHYGLIKLSHRRKGNIKIGQSIAGRVLQENRYYISRDLFKDKRYLHDFIVRKEKLRSLLSVPLIERGKPFGVLSIYSPNVDYFHQEDAKLLSMFASQASISISNARLYERAKENYKDAIKFLANALDAKDSYTAGHSERVADIALEIAAQLRLSETQRETLQYASYLHDLGKVCIDIDTLRKPDKLTSKEWKSIYKHPQVGVDIINNIKALTDLVPIILHHHARYAGGGYPDRSLKQNKIPIGSRILAVADAYEAMVSHRPYRQAFSKEKAMQELKSCAGTQFDPAVVNAFFKRCLS